MTRRPPTTSAQRIRAALAALNAGEPVVVTDDEQRENEGDLIFAAELATAELVAFTVRHTSGFLCVALPGEACDRLGLTPMTHDNRDHYRTAYQVTVDLHGTGTGISAASRAATIAALGSADAGPQDFARPGHVVPLRARPNGVLERPGHTEAAVDLARLAGLTPAGALCEIVSRERPGEMARGDELVRFADEHGLVLLSVADIVEYRTQHEARFVRVAETVMPTSSGTFRALGYREPLTGTEHMVLTAGRVDPDVPVHIHRECLLGDVFGAATCACHGELSEALRTFGDAGRGVIIYLRGLGGSSSCVPLRPNPVPPQGPEIIIASGIFDDLCRHDSAANPPRGEGAAHVPAAQSPRTEVRLSSAMNVARTIAASATRSVALAGD
ncbi:hypothetical protein GCM10023215_20200 [Pseudonocardia yuanmonensis]|uniref:3,4-dihydroxy-2-butanone 4-phosphate synthase n=1 Tax=Pseudonocardia yuanmonensis TaxID=1095914 RepID=A0ABP8WD42_9PSEU